MRIRIGFCLRCKQYVVLLFLSSIILCSYYFGDFIGKYLPGNSYVNNGVNTTEIHAVKQDIYLLETSGKNTLDLRQLASVESIARFVQHDTIRVLIFSKSPIKYNAAMLALSTAYGVLFEQSEMAAFFSGTPLEGWYNSTVWRKGKYRTAHSSDALRAALLWERGGIYLDMDVIMIKPVSFTTPAVVREPSTNSIGNYFLVFDAHNELLELYMTEMARTYTPSVYWANGPPLLTKTFKMYMERLNATGRTSPVTELESEVLSMHELLLVSAKAVMLESKTEVFLKAETNKTMGMHVWNSNTGSTKIKATSKCAYMYYVRKSCPLVYAEMLKVKTV